jgi:predicted GNAT family acetyltransferase
MGFEVRRDATRRRYVATIEGREAHLDFREIDSRTIDLVHTKVPVELRGRGIAGALVHHALEDARARGLHIVPTCPFVRGYLERHPEYGDLVAMRA